MHRDLRDRPHRFRRWAPLAVLATLTALALSGCVRVQAALAVSEDDLVSGQVVIASIATGQDDKGPALTVVPELANRVKAAAYSADGYVGNRVEFQDLTFAEVALLSQTLTVGKQYRLNFRRSGDLVTMSGSVDLSELPADRADVQLKVAFPGSVVQTNGANDNGTVSWSPKPGAATEFLATVQYNNQSGVSWTKWMALVGAIAVAVALLVVALALFTHRRGRRAAEATAPAEPTPSG